MPLLKREALRTKVAPLLTATLASLSLPDFAWFLPLEGSPWCLSRAGLRLLLSLLLKLRSQRLAHSGV